MGTGAPIRRPELTELETFLAAARSGSVVRAGEQLRISKTAAAKRLASLEALVGRRLLDRSPRGVTLTEAGRRLVPKVEQLLAQADETFEHVGLLRRGEDRPRVRGLQAVVGDRTQSTEQVLVDTELLFAEVFHRVDQGILIARTEDRVVVEVNDACCRILEHHREEILGSSAETWDLVSPGDTPAFRRQFEESDAIAELEIDVMVRPGVRKRLAVTARVITIHGQNLTVAALRELTRRERLQDRLMRFYSLVIQPASGVVRAATTHELYQRMCELAVKQSGFALAWVGELDEDTGLVTAAAASGATEYLAELRITVAASDPHGQGPTGTALRELRPATCNDIAADPAMEPWRERAVAHSFASSAAFPLVTHRGARAVLTVYATETDFFTREHSDMLQDLALHASMTLGAQQREAERFRQALAGSGLTAFTMDRELRYTWVENPALGYAPPHQMFARTDAEMMPPEAAAKVSALKRRVIDRGESVAEDVSIATDAGLRWFSITAQPIRDASGAIIGLAGQSTDITERKRAEAERARLATIVESAEDAIFGVNTEGVIETWNRGAERLFGYAAREVLGRSPAILRSPEFGDSRVTDALAGETSRGDGQMLRRDGRVVEVRISVSPIEVDGVIVGTSFIVQDITEQHEAQQARERALRDLEEAQRIARIGSFTRDPDADTATWSPQLFEILERDPALGAPTVDQLMAYLREDERELAKAIFSRRDMTAEHDVRIITGTGKERIMHLAVHPDPSRPGRFTGTIQDITEQQLQAKAAAHLAAIVASSQDAIISITLAGLITSWNDAAQGIYGYSESETLGRHISMLLPEGQADPTTEIMDQVSAGEAASFEATRRRKDGRLIDIATTISPFTDADGRPIGASAIVRVITERGQIEQARARALRDLEEAQRIANIGSFTWEPATDSATWSRQLFAIFERDPALGTPGAQDVLSYLHEDERERWLRSVAQREMQIDDDWRIVTGAGRERTVHMTAHPDRDRPGCFLGTCQDVTEQRRAQEELRRERDFNDVTLDVAGALIVVMDADWRLVRFNRQSELLSGCSEAEVLGRHYEFLVPPEERVRVHANIEAAQAGQVVTQENHWFTRDGGRRLIRWSNQVLRDEAGTFTHLIAVGIDITEQRQAELARKAAEERFRRAFDEAPIGIALLSPDGVLREVNAAIGVICGRELSELAGTRLDALVAPADVENLERALAALVAGRQVITELRITPAVGSVLQVTMHGTLLRGHGHSPQLLCQFQDVTERKRFETQLQFMADHDPLTGLWNRRRFEAELDRHVEAVKRYGPDGALLILDVDDFKAVNDTLGHNIGDQLIVSIADVCSAAAYATRTCSPGSAATSSRCSSPKAEPCRRWSGRRCARERGRHKHLAAERRAQADRLLDRHGDVRVGGCQHRAEHDRGGSCDVRRQGGRRTGYAFYSHHRASGQPHEGAADVDATDGARA